MYIYIFLFFCIGARTVLLNIAGSLCEWKHKTVDKWNESASFDEYMETLFLDCEVPNQIVALTWTVPDDAPSTLYYQVKPTLYLLFQFLEELIPILLIDSVTLTTVSGGKSMSLIQDSNRPITVQY